MTASVLFAAVGDVHGEMHAMVDLVNGWEAKAGARVQFVLQVGDFEPHRDEADLASMAAPAKYRDLGDFQAFLAGERAFPWPVHFIGGNHEPYGFLDQLADGGEVGPNCHYLGLVGAVELGGLRIVGLSGIHSERSYERARPPLNELTWRSNKDYTYFTESLVERALELGPADVLLLHDWPRGLIAPADSGQFAEFRRSRGGIAGIGNEPARLLVDVLEPGLVLCGHMHKRYRNHLVYASGREGQLCCLGKVRHTHPDALSVFSFEHGRIVEVT